MITYILYGLKAPGLRPGTEGTKAIGAFVSADHAEEWIKQGKVPREYPYFGIGINRNSCFRVFASKVLSQDELNKAGYAFGKTLPCERLSGPFESLELAQGALRVLKRMNTGVWKSFLVGFDEYQPGERKNE